MNLKEKKVRLIPFKVESVEATADQIPWGVKKVEAPEMWEREEKGNGIVVAILDTGIDTTHPDLKDRILDGKNFTQEGTENDYTDRNGHGTHVAGIIGASENDAGVVGVAPEVKFVIGKVLDGEGSGDYDGIIRGIQYAINWRGKNDERVRVINMSLGGSEDLPELHQAVKDAVNANIAVVVASGNEGDDNESTMEFGFPGFYNEVIEVSASDENNEVAYFANNNIQVDVIAPGVNVLSTYKGGQYAKLSGTSMATPHVAGCLAILIGIAEKKFGRELTESEIYAQMAMHCFPLGYKASTEGHGLIRMAYACKMHDLANFIDDIGLC